MNYYYYIHCCCCCQSSPMTDLYDNSFDVVVVEDAPFDAVDVVVVVVVNITIKYQSLQRWRWRWWWWIKQEYKCTCSLYEYHNHHHQKRKIISYLIIFYYQSKRNGKEKAIMKNITKKEKRQYHQFMDVQLSHIHSNN